MSAIDTYRQNQHGLRFPITSRHMLCIKSDRVDVLEAPSNAII